MSSVKEKKSQILIFGQIHDDTTNASFWMPSRIGQI
jgi:hypothetical protein